MGLVAVFAFSASTLEVLIPDVHDGDVRGSLIVDAGVGHNTAPTPPSDAPARPHPAPHVDHCTHAHVAAVACGVSMECAPARHEASPLSGASRLVSVAVAPSFRPPIL